MRTHLFALLARRPFHKWVEVGLVAILLAGLNLIEPINKILVRDVISQNVADQRLSYYANEVVIQALLCRRFEKDMLLNIDDDAVRSRYRAQWDEAALALVQAIEGFYAVAEPGADREKAEAWRAARATYHGAMLQTMQAIDAGTITEAEEANRALAGAKDAIRALTDTAMAVAHTKEGAAEASNSELRGALAGSARTLTMLVLGGCLLWIVLRR